MKTQDDQPSELPVRRAMTKGCGLWSPVVPTPPDPGPADSPATDARPGETPADSATPLKGPER